MVKENEEDFLQDISLAEEEEYGDEEYTEEELELEGGYYDSAGLKIEISGNEESVVKWVHSLQQPNKFIGVSGLKIEPDADSGLLRCEAKVRLWYGGE